MPFAEVNGIRLRYETWGIGRRARRLHPRARLVRRGLVHAIRSVWPRISAASRSTCAGTVCLTNLQADYSVQVFASDVAHAADRHRRGAGARRGAEPGRHGRAAARDRASARRALARLAQHAARRLAACTPRSCASGSAVSGRARRPRWTTSRTAWRCRSFPARRTCLLRHMTEQRIAENDPDAYRRATLAVARYRPGGGLRKIACPVLIVAGDSDRVVPGDYQTPAPRGHRPRAIRDRLWRRPCVQHRLCRRGERGGAEVLAEPGMNAPLEEHGRPAPRHHRQRAPGDPDGRTRVSLQPVERPRRAARAAQRHPGRAPVQRRRLSVADRRTARANSVLAWATRSTARACCGS